MEMFGDFFVAFMKPFFKTLIEIFKDIILGLLKMFNILTYVDVIKEYSKWFRGASVSANGSPGGGGGYYGGGCAQYIAGAGGGSSFISGYAGVAAIIEGSITDQRAHKTTYVNSSNQTVQIMDTLHYSGKYFVDAEMQANVNTGNGSARITYLASTLPRVNTALNSVRYIKDCINGSPVNSNNHWVELQAIANGTNTAKGKVATIYNSSNNIVNSDSSYPIRLVTDGDVSTTYYAQGTTASGNQCLVIDLGTEQDLDEVAVWHYWAGGRTYNNNITSVAGTDAVYRTIINRTEPETSYGKRVIAY